MLWTIAVILFIMWALGLVTSYTMSGFIHILLVLAIVAVVLGLIQDRRRLTNAAASPTTGNLVGNSLRLSIALLPLVLFGRDQSAPIPPTETIVRRLIEARHENRNRLRPYEVLRSYQFSKAEALNKS